MNRSSFSEQKIDSWQNKVFLYILVLASLHIKARFDLNTLFKFKQSSIYTFMKYVLSFLCRVQKYRVSNANSNVFSSHCTLVWLASVEGKVLALKIDRSWRSLKVVVYQEKQCLFSFFLRKCACTKIDIPTGCKMHQPPPPLPTSPESKLFIIIDSWFAAAAAVG